VSADAYSAKITELASRYVSDNLRLWQRYGEGLRRVSEGAIPRAGSAAAPSTARSDIPTVARQVMQLNLTHYADLLNTYAEFTNRILTTVFQAPDPAPAASAPAAAAGTRMELLFSGVTGESVSQSFAVANKKAESIDVAFELTEFVSEDGSSRVRAPVTFVPDLFVLSPGAERVVECRVPLIAAFATGTRYMAMVRVTGFPALETALIVVPLEAATQQRAEHNDPAQAAPTVDTIVLAQPESVDKAAAAKDVRPRRSTGASGKKRRMRKKGPPRSP
jgi:hypothetical protein